MKIRVEYAGSACSPKSFRRPRFTLHRAVSASSPFMSCSSDPARLSPAGALHGSGRNSCSRDTAAADAVAALSKIDHGESCDCSESSGKARDRNVETGRSSSATVFGQFAWPAWSGLEVVCRSGKWKHVMNPQVVDRMHAVVWHAECTSYGR